MIWIFFTIILVIAFVVLYGLGYFIPHITHTAFIGFAVSVEHLFAFTLQSEKAANWLPVLDSISANQDSLHKKNGSFEIKIADKTLPVKVVTFIPNYRWACTTNINDVFVNVQITFYKKGKTESRIVLIIKTITESRLKRTWMAIRKQKTERQMLQVLELLKKEVEKSEPPINMFENTNAEENPNLTL